MSTIAERLLLLRGTTKQGEFAKILDVNPNTLRTYENGRSNPNQEFLERICVQFSVSADWLLLGRDPMRPGEPTSEPQTPVEQPVIPTKTADHCPQCVELKVELEEERRERREKDKEVRELSAENRKLWKENGELKEENATLRERQRKTEIEVVFDERQNIPVSEARI